MMAVDTYFQRTARDTRRTTTCLLVSVKMYTIVLVVTCFQHFVGESHCKSVLPARVTAHGITSVIDGESHQVNASQAGDWRDSDGQLSRTKTPDDDSIADNALLLVTVVKEHHTTGKGDTTFWVDGALLDMTVTVVVQGKGQGRYLLVDHRGKRPEALMSSRGNTVWTIHRPTAGQWRVVPERDGGYEVTVQGSSVLDVEVTLYDIDVRSGLAVLVHQSPTAGHQIRAIIDVIGADVMKNVYNMSLVTSDGVELASNWLRPAGGPQDPQFSTTFTWPTQAVFIRVYGQELGGDAFERQTSFIITPILIDLRLQQGEPSGADGSLVVRYELINNGQSDFFQLTAHVDNELFTAVVSPANIRLGHLGSFDGSVTVSVPRYSTSKSGLLTVRVWSEKDPKLIQSADLLLTSPHTVTDLDPPYCRTLSMTGNCTRRDVTSPTCRLRHWVARASVEDDVSGLREVTFAEVTPSDTFHVDHFLEGLAGRPVAVIFRATCCKDSIVLEAKDLAGNQRQCPFLQEEIHHPVPSPTSLTSTTPSTTPPRLPVSSARQSDSLVSTTVGNPGHHSSSYETTVVSVTTGQSRTTVTVGTNGTSALTLLNDTFAISDAVTHARGSSKPQADYSILKKASIILGSIGGFAGLCIGLLCFLLFCRHRRMLQRHNSCDSQSSCDTDCHHDHSSSSNNNNFYHHHSSSSSNNCYHHHNSSSSNNNFYHHHNSSSSSNNCYHHHNSSSSSCHHHYNSSNNSHHHHPSNGHQHRSWNDDNGQRHLSSNSRHHHGNESRHHHGNESRHHRSNNGHIHRHSSYVVSTASRRSNDGSGWIVPDVLPEGAAVTEHSTSL